MDIAKKFRVEVKKDHLSKIATGTPKTGLCELIWNALDADASIVDVNFVEGPFGIDRVIVSDNGVGMPYQDAEKLFVGLGGSWKIQGKQTKKGRFLHGQEGQGRFKAFTIGRITDWNVVYKDDAEFFEYTIEGKADALDEFSLSSNKASTALSTGVKVEISEINKQFRILNADKALDELAPIFALYLRRYSGIVLRINGQALDTSSIVREVAEIDLPPLVVNDTAHDVRLEVVEWNGLSDREIWFADSEGFPLESYDKRVRGIGEVGFSAYIQSEYFRELNRKGLLSLRHLESSISDCCESAISALKEHFLTRALEEAKGQINEWIDEEVYPFTGEPLTPLEDAERKVFDIVAININKSLPDFRDSNKKSKTFQLRMLKQAIEKSPDDLQTIMNEVLNLPKGVREDLADLLQNTSLSSIISASKIVSDRIQFVSGLEQLVFEYKDNVKERSQLHRILAKNTWVFGEQFALSVDDQSLTEVLKKHASHLDDELVIDEPVVRIDQRRGIVDLMLSRQMPRNRADELEHLVVELKAPKVDIGKKEIDQIESYAFAVAEDARFRSINTKWDFWIISGDYDGVCETQARR